MLKISKKIITYYIDIELTEKEEEILESIASSCNMTLSEYTRFLIKQKIHKKTQLLVKGVVPLRRKTLL